MLGEKGKGRKEERTKICLTKGKDGRLSRNICFSLSFPKCHSNGRKDPHVTTTIKQESIQSADKFFEEFLDIRNYVGKRPLQKKSPMQTIAEMEKILDSETTGAMSRHPHQVGVVIMSRTGLLKNRWSCPISPRGQESSWWEI